MDKLYRYETVSYAPSLDEDNYPVGASQVKVELHTFDIIGKTKCGVWINYRCTKKFVNQNARKQFANKTPTEARLAFIARKKRQLRILQHQLETVKQSLVLIQLE